MTSAPAATGPVSEALSEVRLVDHHCHGVATADLDPERFESLISEGGGAVAPATNFDAPAGTAIRRYCAPVIDLDRHASPADYLARRAELGWQEVNRRLLAEAGTGAFYVDTGFAPAGITSPVELGRLGSGDGLEIVRLETVAEGVAAAGVDAAEFADRLLDAARTAVAERGAVGCKSVAAYRTGFDLDPRRPTPAEVTAAAAAWLTQGSGQSDPSCWRLSDPLLVRHLLWTAVDVGLPLQLHTGLGDSDIRMHRVDPTHLTDWLHLIRGTIPVVLLHCWPYQRQAAYLATVFADVYFDVGLTLHYVGPARARTILEEALEITPFHKMLYSSDAYGVAEFYQLGALAFRRGLGTLLDDRVAGDEISLPDARRLAEWIGRENSRRVYRTATDD